MENQTTACVSNRTCSHFLRRTDVPSGQSKRSCSTIALRRISVDVSPSTSLEVFELFVKIRVLCQPVIHILYPLIYFCGVSVKELVCQEELQTTDEISRRIMSGAAVARRDQKQKEKMRSQRNRFEPEVDQVCTCAITKARFPRAIFSNAALSSDVNNRNSCFHEQQSRSVPPFPLSSISSRAARHKTAFASGRVTLVSALAALAAS